MDITDIMNVNYLYIIIIILILFKSFIFFNKIKNKEIKEVKKPTLEYYNWKMLFYKMIVLKKLYKKRNHRPLHHPYKNKWLNSIKNKSAHF
jgi:hypothetical protein